MALSLIILKQIILMFIYMTIGFLLYKKKFVTKQGSKELGLILLYVILPVVIVKAYLVTFSAELLRGLALSFAASLLVLLLSMLLSRIVFRSKYPIEQFSSAFSNAGFIGIPWRKRVRLLIPIRLIWETCLGKRFLQTRNCKR